MYTPLHIASAGRSVPEAVAVLLLGKPSTLPRPYAALDRAAGGVLAAALRRPELNLGGGEVSVTTLYPQRARPGRHAQRPTRVFLIDLGKPERFKGDALRVAAAKLVAACYAAKVTRVRIETGGVLSRGLTAEAVGRALGDGLAIGSFQFDQFKSKGDRGGNGSAAARRLVVELPEPLVEPASRALIIGDSVSLTRRLQATPPNVANPAYIVAQARKVTRAAGLTIRVIDAARARKLGLRGLLAVGAAGSTQPALIVLEHRPRSPRRKPAGPLMLVGKAVTFDTGGYSIKPADSMTRMKYDKSGGMAVLGAMQAAAELKLPLHVVGLIPTAENMIAEGAYRPDDILTMYNGVTVEVTNTDAEGRLILADALAYGCRIYKPSAVIDLATLTGGVVVALGSFSAGMFVNDEPLKRRLLDAADFTGEPLWQLPLWEEHKSLLKGTHSDIVNSGGREAHPIQAAFLSYFVSKTGDKPRSPKDEIPWAHLDIAGMSDVKNATPLFAKGPTAFGVRLLVRLMEQWR